MEEIRQRAADYLIETLSAKKIEDSEKFFKLRRETAEKFSVSMLKNDELARSYHKMIKDGTIKANKIIEDFVKSKKIRSQSGIVVVSILTKPYKCPGNCLYCPSQEGLPKSYMKNEPAVMRAILNGFDPFRQVQNRLEALKATGHPLDKINIRIIGGTWSYYPKSYQTWYIREMFNAANNFGIKNQESRIRRKSLLELQMENETAKCRIVEISIETRQDFIDKAEISRLRQLGVTKVELGVQSIYDDVLLKNRRGHDVECTISATKMLKDAGFKVAYQIMLNLVGTEFEKDRTMLRELFEKPEFRPDYLKIYPLAMVKEAEIYKLFKKGKLKIYDDKQLMELIGDFKANVAPKYLRIERIIRDIPSEDIVEGGAKISNLRQIIQEKLELDEKRCQCIRCREVGSGEVQDDVRIFREDYEASGGREIFLSVESNDRSVLYSILRLRIPSSSFGLEVLNGAGIIREMHTYGPQLSIGNKSDEAAQHRGFGKMLLAEAEKIAKDEFGYKKMAVIAGIGVREYFRKIGYDLDETYMVKYL